MSNTNDDTAARRYWTKSLQAAHAFMLEIRNYPVEECGEQVVPLAAEAEQAGVEVAFSCRPHATGGPRLFVLRASLVDGLLQAAEALARRDWRLVIEDCYRTRDMQRALAFTDAVFDRVVERTVWELRGHRPSAELLTRRLGALVAACPKVGTHMSGSAVDVSVIARRTGQELDRGGGYLEISERTPMQSPFIPPEARRIRDVVTEVMHESGFVAYPYEFWHYSRGDAYAELLGSTEAPARFGPVDVDLLEGNVKAILNATEPLNEPAALETKLAERLQALPNVK